MRLERDVMSDPLQPFLDRQGVVILDGGLATELEARGERLDDPLWSAAVLLDRPERIRQVHEDYLRAGADCLVTASYQATFEGLARRGLSAAEADRVLRRSVAVADEARRSFCSVPGRDEGRLPPLVAASVGPYGAYLADGSEYRGDYGLTVGELSEFHRRRLEVLSDAGADLLAVETIPSLAEVRALLELLERLPGPPAWVSFSCRDGRHLCDGTPLRRAVRLVSECGRVVAVGVNCTAPRHLTSLLREAAAVSRLPLVAYPNSGEGWDAASRRWLAGDESSRLRRECLTWRSLGARLVGGCCRTGPADIAALRSILVASPGQSPASPSSDRVS